MYKLMLLSIYLFFAATGYSQQPKDTIVKEDYSDDWAALHHYAAENKQLPPAAAGEKRVVFLGSYIFERWKPAMPDFFNSHPYLDRGISGQIAPQLLIRFRQDVIDLHFAPHNFGTIKHSIFNKQHSIFKYKTRCLYFEY